LKRIEPARAVAPGCVLPRPIGATIALPLAVAHRQNFLHATRIGK
jgi:hypothetical protein